MTVNIVTTDDLQRFKQELLNELTQVVERRTASPVKWLKAYQVQELLGISRGTLQNLRINGTLSYSKVGGLTFYSYDDIQKMMKPDKADEKRKNPKRPL